MTKIRAAGLSALMTALMAGSACGGGGNGTPAADASAGASSDQSAFGGDTSGRDACELVTEAEAEAAVGGLDLTPQNAGPSSCAYGAAPPNEEQIAAGDYSDIHIASVVVSLTGTVSDDTFDQSLDAMADTLAGFGEFSEGESVPELQFEKVAGVGDDARQIVDGGFLDGYVIARKGTVGFSVGVFGVEHPGAAAVALAKLVAPRV